MILRRWSSVGFRTAISETRTPESYFLSSIALAISAGMQLPIPAWEAGLGIMSACNATTRRMILRSTNPWRKQYLISNIYIIIYLIYPEHTNQQLSKMPKANAGKKDESAPGMILYLPIASLSLPSLSLSLVSQGFLEEFWDDWQALQKPGVPGVFRRITDKPAKFSNPQKPSRDLGDHYKYNSPLRARDRGGTPWDPQPRGEK